MARDKNCKLHAIVIPLPYQGHINPHINLAFKLASKGITVTLVHFDFVHHKLSKSHNDDVTEKVDIFSEARKSGLDIHYTTFDDGFPLEFDRVLRLEEYLGSVLRDFQARFDELIEKTIKSDPCSLHFVVADACFPWITLAAKNYNLVHVAFWTQPAAVFSLNYHKDLMEEHGHFPVKDDLEEEINYVPGVESISTRDIMPYLKESNSQTYLTKSVIQAFKEMKEADFILHNTVHQLESQTISALNRYQPNYTIGPVHFSKNLAATTVTKSLLSETDCIDWLNSKPPGSVLYVSFGSIVPISKLMIEEIAHGLLLSKVNFIWVVRSGIMGYEDSDILPNQFMAEIKGRGLIIPWCNQITVLSNPAVQGFLTHCGWNSVLESIWCGVPMLCFPVYYDQPICRKLVVDNWKIGINLSDGKSVHRETVAEKIRSIMYGTSSESLKQEMKKVKAEVQNAIQIGGSSENNLDQFVNDLKAKINATTANT